VDFGPLIRRLIEIEISVGHESPLDTRRRVIDAEECLLEIQATEMRKGQPQSPLTRRWAMPRRWSEDN
jgi:hypothetical protein